MRNIIILFILLQCLLYMVSCDNSGSNIEEDKKETLLSQVDSLEKKMGASEMIDVNTAEVLVNKYVEYFLAFPSDSIVPEYLFRAGGLARAIGKPYEAIDAYKNICGKYPAYKHVPEALFQQGLIYDSDLNNDSSAKIIYEQVIAKYPDIQYAKDAKKLIEYLGKTDEELIEQFSKMNQ